MSTPRFWTQSVDDKTDKFEIHCSSNLGSDREVRIGRRSFGTRGCGSQAQRASNRSAVIVRLRDRISKGGWCLEMSDAH